MSDGRGVFSRERVEELYREVLGDEREEDPARWRKRMRILRAATELFIRHGYRKTSVDEIARRAEVAKGTVYLYFPNKGQLLVQAVALEKRALFDTMAPLLDGTLPPRDRLRFWMEVVLTAPLELPLVARLLREDAELKAALEDAGPEVVAQSEAVGKEWLAALIEQAAPGRFSEDEKDARAHVLLGVRYLTGLMTDDRILQGRPLRAVARTLADMIVYGAVHRPPDEGE